MKKKTSSLLIAGILLGATASPVLANNEAMLNLLQVLRDQGTITAENYRLLANAAKSDSEAIEKVANKVKAIEKNTATVSLKGGHLKFKSHDSAFSAQVGGRIMTDYAFIDDDRNMDGDGSEMRRARVFLKGKIFNDWAYKAQFDFAEDSLTTKDLYIAYKGFKPVTLKLGNHKVANGLEESTSSKYITFMERSTINDLFAVGRKNGLSIATGGSNWTFMTALHMDGVGNSNADQDEDYGYGARLTFAPLSGKTKTLHLGVSAHRQEYESTPLVGGTYGQQRFRARPEIHTINTRPYDTRIDGVDSADTFGLESAVVFGPFSVQAEYYSKGVSTTTDDVDFDGWYLYGSYFLTGESRNYKAKKGSFGRVKPTSIVGKGGHGAWEVALRYSDIDLYDTGAAINTMGEKGDITTIGLNWYATPTIRFMANYVMANVEYPGTTNPDDDIKAFQLRGQIDF
ncbi:MAG: hypothetical protein L3J26_02425 [Candidatus Polarisedimenticolaceae bacterium]|nr:hypothetical protein [Candidatus Polarisedimenticolaceae bacterium]